MGRREEMLYKQIDIYKKDLGNDPKNAQAHYNMGAAFLELHKVSEARKAHAELVGLDAGLAEQLLDEIESY